MMQTLSQTLKRAFRDRFGHSSRVALAPGRINLIGEHTDYNDGFVLPLAIDQYVGVAFAPRSDRMIQAYALDFEEEHAVDLDALGPGTDGHRGWSRYVAGVAWALREEGLPVRGADVVIQGEVPLGAGLSSSAALEVSLARAFCAVSGIPWHPARMARLCQKAENDFVGLSCGIMDQYTAAAGAEDHALLLDCRSMAVEPIPIPASAAIVVMDTGVRRALTESSYNGRVSQCREAVTVLRTVRPEIRALRDVSSDFLERHRDLLAPETYQRARHVVGENERTQAAAEALRIGDLPRVGALMAASHASLRDRYEVSSPELDFLAATAMEHPSCFGARLTGAGLGGCAIALVERAACDDFIATVHQSYRECFDHPSVFYTFAPAAGAHLVSA